MKAYYCLLLILYSLNDVTHCYVLNEAVIYALGSIRNQKDHRNLTPMYPHGLLNYYVIHN